MHNFLIQQNDIHFEEEEIEVEEELNVQDDGNIQGAPYRGEQPGQQKRTNIANTIFNE